MKRISKQLKIFSVLAVMAVSLQFCKTGDKVPATAPKAENMVSYEASIQPIMERSCTPCHFPEQGQKKMLDTYGAVKANIKDIIARIELPADEKGYMPFKSKKPALTPDEIELFKKWMAQGMGK